MRKRFKQKKESCALCKPHKMGWQNRWKDKELSKLEETEKVIAQVKQNGFYDEDQQ